MTHSSLQAVRILKAGAAGAILALALIHVLGDSFTDFGSLPEDAASPVVISYPWASLCMLASIIFMVSRQHPQLLICGEVDQRFDTIKILVEFCRYINDGFH